MAEFNNPYDAVIADLEAKRAELDRHIEYITRLRDAFAGGSAATADLSFQLSPVAQGKIPSDAFFGMTIADAAVKYLQIWANRKPQSTNAIIEALEAGGMEKKAYTTVYGILNRRANKEQDVVNVKGDWGLADWYGGSKARKPQKKGVPLNVFEHAEEAEEPAGQESEEKVTT